MHYRVQDLPGSCPEVRRLTHVESSVPLSFSLPIHDTVADSPSIKSLVMAAQGPVFKTIAFSASNE